MAGKFQSSSQSFDDVMYSPETDDMLDDRLEQARLNRTNFYRKMLSSRNRPVEDYYVSTKSSHVRGSPTKEASISDTITGQVPKIPEPHSSWRFYTSYDNGEWKRHAVPVYKEEEEILREPTKTQRKERETISPPAQSCLRRMRQSGGPLVACLQPRPKRAPAENVSDGRQMECFQVVNGVPVNVPIGAGMAGQVGFADWANFYENGDLVRRLPDGEYILTEGEPAQGSVKQEFSSKYTSTVTVKQPNGLHLSPGAAGGGEGRRTGGGMKTDVAEKEEAEGAGVRKSRRPRIYGFQEKIIIPTKYKTAANAEDEKEASKENMAAAVQLTSKTEETERRTVGQHIATDGSKFKGGSRLTDTSKSSPAAAEKTSRSSMVKVVVVNNDGSDAESENTLEKIGRESEEKKSEKKSEEKDLFSSSFAHTNPAKPGSIIQIPILLPDGTLPVDGIKAWEQSLQQHLIPEGFLVNDKSMVALHEDKTASNPNNRVFSKEEETFSEVGPDGSKRDGKVSHTYEVFTTTTDDNPVQDRHISSGEKTTRDEDSVQDNRILQNVKPLTVEKGHLSKTKEVSPRMERKKTDDIFEQTGSMFKQIAPRPREVREREFSGGVVGLQRKDDRGIQKKSGGISICSKSEIATRQDGLRMGVADVVPEKAPSNIRKVEIVRMHDERGSQQNALKRSEVVDSVPEKVPSTIRKGEIVRMHDERDLQQDALKREVVDSVPEKVQSNIRKVEIIRMPDGDVSQEHRSHWTSQSGFASTNDKNDSGTSARHTQLFEQSINNVRTQGTSDDDMYTTTTTTTKKKKPGHETTSEFTDATTQWEVQVAVKD